MNSSFYITAATDLELVCSCGAFAYPEHSHVSVLTLHLVRAGQVVVRMHGQERRYTAGSCFSIAPYQPHVLVRDAASEMISLCLARHRFAGANAGAQLLACATPLLRQALLRQSELAALAALLPEAPRPCLQHEDPITTALRCRFESCPEQSLPLEQLVAVHGRSLWHTIRCFKDAVGLTPHRFQIQNRIRRAKRLLQGEQSLANVALSAGFCDQSHLNRCFTHATGLTPARYRAACLLLSSA